MRVLHLLDTTRIAGTETHVLTLLRALQGAGVDAWLGCLPDGDLARRAGESGLRVLGLPAGAAAHRPRSMRALCSLVRAHHIDLLHAHNGRTALAAAFARAFGPPVGCVATQHFIDPARLSQRGLRRAASACAHRWIERRVQRYVAISDAVRDAMLARGETRPEKIRVVPNGIFPPEVTRPPEAIRQDLGLGAGTFVIVCASRLESEKSVDVLVDAMAPLVVSHPHVVCLVAGEGAQRPQIERQIAAHNLAGRVRLLGFRADVASLMNAADLFVLPSTVEGFGLVVVEAMALGKPVIATAAGGPLEIVVNGHTGLLVPPSDPAALAGAIATLLTDRQNRRAMAVSGKARFRELFTAEHMAALMMEVYREVLDNRSV